MASRRSVVTLMSTISLLVFPLNTRAADAPMAMIQTATQKTLAVLQNPAYQGAAHCGERLAQVAATILPHFDTEGMSQRALGLYWRQLTTDQQQEFVRLFTALVEHAYGGAIDRHARDVQVTIFRLLKTRGAAGAKELLGEGGGLSAPIITRAITGLLHASANSVGRICSENLGSAIQVILVYKRQFIPSDNHSFYAAPFRQRLTWIPSPTSERLTENFAL